MARRRNGNACLPTLNAIRALFLGTATAATERSYRIQVHGSGTWTRLPQPRPGSSDADIARASELQHAVERMNGDVHLGRPTLVRGTVQRLGVYAASAHGRPEPGDGSNSWP